MSAIKKIIIIDKDLAEIMPTFLENRKKDLINLQKFIAIKDLQKIAIIAHKIAGNAGSYGMHDLGQIGSELEIAVKDSKIELIKELIQKYHDYMNSVEIKYG